MSSNDKLEDARQSYDAALSDPGVSRAETEARRNTFLRASNESATEGK